MTWLLQAFQSSIGKKQIVAISGLLMCGFLAVHLAGNLILFAGQEAFDSYAESLTGNPWLLYPAEAGLLALFALHIVMALRVAFENITARGGGLKRYAVRNNRGAETAASATMVVSGVIVLVFLVIHVLHFRFGDRSVVDGSLYKLVMLSFQQSIGYTVWYIVASFVVAFHVSHGLQSAFRTLGVHDSRTSTIFRRLGLAFAFIVAVGFGSLPVYASFFAEKVSQS